MNMYEFNEKRAKRVNNIAKDLCSTLYKMMMEDKVLRKKFEAEHPKSPLAHIMVERADESLQRWSACKQIVYLFQQFSDDLEYAWVEILTYSYEKELSHEVFKHKQIDEILALAISAEC